MTILVRCPLVSCNKLTGWQYPNFEWARNHVPGLPGRCFVPADKYGNNIAIIASKNMCPDPFGHVNKFKAARGDQPLPLPDALQTSTGSDPDHDDMIVDLIDVTSKIGDRPG